MEGLDEKDKPYDETKDQDECGVKQEFQKYPKPPCNPRLEELSRPTNRLLFVNYHLFNCVLPRERVQDIQQILKEEWAISTECVQFIVTLV